MNVTQEIMTLMLPNYTPKNNWSAHSFYNSYYDSRIQQLTPGFQGLCGKLAEDWFQFIHFTPESVINYLEIGALHGANVISVSRSYCINPNSTITVVDPYAMSEEYSEYIGEELANYNTFCYNMQLAGIQNKVQLFKTFSHIACQEFQDKYFDIVYIDGNHKGRNVLEDAVMYWRKLNSQGWLVFNAYSFPQNTSVGINAFCTVFAQDIKKQFYHMDQYFIQKS
jgi:hypothetical protein